MATHESRPPKDKVIISLPDCNVNSCRVLQSMENSTLTVKTPSESSISTDFTKIDWAQKASALSEKKRPLIECIRNVDEDLQSSPETQRDLISGFDSFNLKCFNVTRKTMSIEKISQSNEEKQDDFVTPNKNEKLTFDNIDEKLFDIYCMDSCTALDEIKRKSSLGGYRDLFGELLPLTGSVSKTNFVKKLPVKSKRKKLYKDCAKNSSVSISTESMIKAIQETPVEPNSIMQHTIQQTSSENNRIKKSGISVKSVNDTLNISGVHELDRSLSPSLKIKTRCLNSCLVNNINKKEWNPIFKGVLAFIDYKVNHGDSDRLSIKHFVEKLGGKSEKTFNLKVTHVIFRNGSRKTYETAKNRNIPLVSAKWVNNSRIANKMLNPIDFPAYDTEKYTVKKEVKLNHNHVNYCKKFKKYLSQSYINHGQLLKTNRNGLEQKNDNFVTINRINKTSNAINATCQQVIFTNDKNAKKNK